MLKFKKAPSTRTSLIIVLDEILASSSKGIWQYAMQCLAPLIVNCPDTVDGVLLKEPSADASEKLVIKKIEKLLKWA